MRLMFTLLNVNVMNCRTKWENVKIWPLSFEPYSNILLLGLTIHNINI